MSKLPRTIRWKLQLGIFELPDQEDWNLDDLAKHNDTALRSQRKLFDTLVKEYLPELDVASQLSVSSGELDPLSIFAKQVEVKERRNQRHASKNLPVFESDEASTMEDIELDEDIELILSTVTKDLKRLPVEHNEVFHAYMHQKYNSDEEDSAAKRAATLKEVLYVFAREHPILSYQQGMHEIASLLCLVAEIDILRKDEVVPTPLLDYRYLAHEVYAMMDALFVSIKPAYSGDCLDVVSKIRFVSGEDKFLRYLVAMDIDPELYCARWIRLLFSREVTHWKLALPLIDFFMDLTSKQPTVLSLGDVSAYNRPGVVPVFVPGNIDWMTVLETSAACLIWTQRAELLKMELDDGFCHLVNLPPMDSIGRFMSTILSTMRRVQHNRKPPRTNIEGLDIKDCEQINRSRSQSPGARNMRSLSPAGNRVPLSAVSMRSSSPRGNRLPTNMRGHSPSENRTPRSHKASSGRKTPQRTSRSPMSAGSQSPIGDSAGVKPPLTGNRRGYLSRQSSERSAWSGNSSFGDMYDALQNVADSIISTVIPVQVPTFSPSTSRRVRTTTGALPPRANSLGQDSMPTPQLHAATPIALRDLRPVVSPCASEESLSPLPFPLINPVSGPMPGQQPPPKACQENSGQQATSSSNAGRPIRNPIAMNTLAPKTSSTAGQHSEMTFQLLPVVSPIRNRTMYKNPTLCQAVSRASILGQDDSILPPLLHAPSNNPATSSRPIKIAGPGRSRALPPRASLAVPQQQQEVSTSPLAPGIGIKPPVFNGSMGGRNSSTVRVSLPRQSADRRSNWSRQSSMDDVYDTFHHVSDSIMLTVISSPKSPTPPLDPSSSNSTKKSNNSGSNSGGSRSHHQQVEYGRCPNRSESPKARERSGSSGSLYEALSNLVRPSPPV